MSSNPKFELIDRKWGLVLDQAITADHSELHVICPFIKRTTAERLLRAGRPQIIKVLTRFRLADFCDGVNDLTALRLLLQNGAQIKGIRNLHAKLYLFGNTRAIVTSANLTEAALLRNHEFGFVADDKFILRRCREYFDHLWPKAGSLLSESQLTAWETQIDQARTRGAGPADRTGLKDYGTDIGFEVLPSENAPFVEISGQAFVKFFGKKSRAKPTTQILEEVDSSGSHWACSYPRNKRPRQVLDGDIMYIARLARDPRDILIYGRAIAMRYKPDRDDATEQDKRRRDWKGDWPHYIRIHHAEFIAGILANGISLYRLMDDLQAESFASTQDNAAAGVNNINPRLSIRRQPHIRLSPAGHAWLQREFDAALARYGRIPDDELAHLDWPTIP